MLTSISTLVRPAFAILACLLCGAPASAGLLYALPGPVFANDNGVGSNLPGMSISRSGSASDTLYFRWSVHPSSDFTEENYFAALQFFLSGGERLGIGNAFGPFAYSVFNAAGASTLDLDSSNPEPGAPFQFVRDTDTTTLVVKVEYNAAADDDITVWLDPDLSLDESQQPASLTTFFQADASFDELRLREGISGPVGADGWSFAGIRIANAWSDAVRLPVVTRGPYLQLGADDRMTVRWRTDLPTETRVLFGTDPGSLGAPQTVRPELVTEHTDRLTGLEPGTRYYYAIEAGGQVLAGGDASTFFETSPAAGAVDATRIWVIGDSGTADNDALDVFEAYRSLAGERYTDLWLMLGDNAYEDGTDAEYEVGVFDLYRPLLQQTPVWPTLGNHDSRNADSATESGVYYDIFDLPRAGEAGGTSSGTEAYYSFEHANIHFIVLDSDDTDRSPSGAMYSWLIADLQDTVTAGNMDWIIAFWHHPPYSKGSHDSDDPLDSSGRLVEMRQNFLPLLESFGVDLVLSGHSHSYERSVLIDGHYGTSDTFGPSHTIDGGDGDPAGNGSYTKTTLGQGTNEGTVYAVSGSGGRGPDPVGDHPAMLVELSVLGSMVLDVNGSELRARFLDDSATIRDTFRIQKGSFPASASIDGRVWLDEVPDGVRADSEPNLSGVAVNLLDANRVPLRSTTTNSIGAWSFTQLNQGAYIVEVEPGRRGFAVQGGGSEPLRDSDFDEATGEFAFMIGAGSALFADAGLIDPTPLPGTTTQLADIDVEPYPGFDTGEGIAESRESGAGYFTTGTRWIQTLDAFDIAPETVLTFEYRSQTPGQPSAIGFDDDGNPATGLRLFDLGDANAPFTRPVPQRYLNAGGWQTYRIPVGRYYTGTGLRLVLGVTTPRVSTEHRFTQGMPVSLNGAPSGSTYTGMHDAELREDSPDGNFDSGADTGTDLNIDGDEPPGSGLATQTVMRFDSIIGPAPEQIESGTRIERAQLLIDVDNAGDEPLLYELSTGFGAETSVTWNSVGGGIDPATQTTNTPIPVPAEDRPFYWLDVTDTVQSWVDGRTNHGWAFLPTGGNGVDIDSSENGTASERPQLIIVESEQTSGTPSDVEIRNVRVPEPGIASGLLAGVALLRFLALQRRK